MSRPSVTLRCPADRYAGPDARIVEFDSDAGGGLIEFRVANGRLGVHAYRIDSAVDVTSRPATRRAIDPPAPPLVYQCQNCDWHGAEDATREARDVAKRHASGDTFSDRECPKCGALVFPREDSASSAPAALEPGATPESMTREAESLLRRARDLLAKAGAPRAADKVRAAIKSAGGAVRHAEAKATRQPAECGT